MTLEIRPARVEDVAALLELHREVHELHLVNRPDQFKPTLDQEIAAKFRKQLEASDTKVWVAELDGKLVGHAVAVHYQRPEGPNCPARQWWDVDQIGVASDYRRSGIGRALLRTVVDAATAAGIQQIELNSWAFNREAHAAFESFGFAPKYIRFELKR
jgi:GNAT superfamily N-acetyltransferase